LTIAVMVLAAIYLPTESVVLPTHFEDIARPDAFGLVIAALAGGSTVGAFGYGWLSARLSRLTLTRIVLVGTMISIVPLAMLPPLPVMLLAAFVLGLSWGPMNPLLTTIVQRRVPADAQGRVFGIQLSVFYAAPPIAMLLTGLAIESWGVRITYLVLAALMVATSGAVLLMRSIRGVND
jgi:MFS family permease